MNDADSLSSRSGNTDVLERVAGKTARRVRGRASPPRHLPDPDGRPQLLRQRRLLSSRSAHVPVRWQPGQRPPPKQPFGTRSGSLAATATTHPALIPQESAGDSRPSRAIAATACSKDPHLGQSPAYPGSGRKYQDRPVTPEVAGSSPVAPADIPANRHFLLLILAQSTAGFPTGHALVPHANFGPGTVTESAAN
jgi:hypothetical protein